MRRDDHFSMESAIGDKIHHGVSVRLLETLGECE